MHRFRRTAATLALNRGMPIDQVKEMLGHEPYLELTYASGEASAAAKALETFNEVFSV